MPLAQPRLNVGLACCASLTHRPDSAKFRGWAPKLAADSNAREQPKKRLKNQRVRTIISARVVAAIRWVGNCLKSYCTNIEGVALNGPLYPASRAKELNNEEDFK